MWPMRTQQITCRTEYLQFVIFASVFLFQIFLFQIFFQNPADAAIFRVTTVPQLVQALSDSAINGEEDIIKVRQGTYVGNFIYASKEAFGLTIEGGYSSDFSSRDTDPLKTVLDGNKKQRVLYLYSAAYPVNLKANGITIQNGFCSTAGGGGLYARTTGKVIVSDCCIRNNISTVTNYKNSSYSSGIVYNGGGGSYIQSDNVEIFNNTFSGNSSGSEGGALFVETPAYPFYSGLACSIKMRGNRVIDNNSLTSGAGGISILNVRKDRRFEVIFDRNTVSGNSSVHGTGGVNMGHLSSLVFTSNYITGNNGGDSGSGGNQVSGGVSLYSTHLNFSNNVVAANSSQGTGGVLLSAGGDTFQYIWQTGTLQRLSYRNSSYIINNTITGNSCSKTGIGGLVLILSENIDMAVQNNILWENFSTGQKITDLRIKGSVSSTVNLFNNDINQSISGSFIQGLRYTSEDNLNSQNPQFINPENGDYRLLSTSPCIDRGRVDGSMFSLTDLSGHSRVLNGNIDIGAYEQTEECDLPYHSDYHYIQWGCRNTDTFYCIDILDENRNMVHQAIECGEGVHSFSPEELDLAPGNYHWKVWSPSAENYFTYGNDTDFEGSFTVPEINRYQYISDEGSVQWGTRGDDTFYCIDIFDSDWNMLYQAAACGEGLHNFSPLDLGLPVGIYYWKVWSPGGYGDDGFRGAFNIQKNDCDAGVISRSSLIAWSCSSERYYCVDIFDENWNMLHQAAACAEGLGSFSPRKLNLPPGLYHWKTWTPYYVECSDKISGCGNGGEGSFATDGYMDSSDYRYRSGSTIVQWFGYSGVQCVDIFDSGWNLLQKDAACVSGSNSFSPKDLGLPPGNYYWSISDDYIDGLWGGFTVN